MLNSGVELLQQPATVEGLRALADKPLFWFIRDKKLESIQCVVKDEEFNFGSAHIETLGSGAAGKLNEDALMALSIGEGRTLFAVFDGASSQKQISSLDSEGISGAFYISHLVSMGFGMTSEYKELCQKSELTAKDIMVAMNDWIYKKMKEVPGVDYSDIPFVPGMAAALLLVDQLNKRLTIAQVADATIASVSNNGKIKVLTPNLNERFDQETMKYVTELAQKYNSDLLHIRDTPEVKENDLIHRQLVDSFIRKTNKRGGCGVMNGMSEMVSNGLVYTDEIEMNGEVSSILMFSDGAILPFSGKNISIEDAVKSLIDVLHRRKNSSILALGASILDNDPDFVKVPRLKLKDDSTIIEVRFSAK